MKKIAIIIFLLCGTLSAQIIKRDSTIVKSPKPVMAVWLQGGKGKLGVGGALGFRYEYFGLSIGSVGSADDMPSYQDYTIPHSSYELETYSKASLVVDVYGFLPAFTNMISLYANVGYTSQTDSTLARSTATGMRYIHSSETKSSITYGGGVQLLPWNWVVVGAGWHNILGIQGMLGYRF